MLARVFFAALLAASCNVKKSPAETPHANERLEDLKSRFAIALQDYEDDTVSGWPSLVDCDALMWAGLAAAAGAEVDLSLAEYAPGEMHRRPAPACYSEDGEDNGSKSTISRDMLVGYMLGLWQKRDLAAAERLAFYGERHNWVMGRGDLGRILMGTNLQGALGRMIDRLGGSQRSYRFLPAFYLPAGKDFERHIAVLGLVLQGEVSQGLNFDQLEALKSLAQDSPSDALFQAARGIYDGDFSRPIDLLLGNYVSPSYVRGDMNYHRVHWLFATSLVLKQYR